MACDGNPEKGEQSEKLAHIFDVNSYNVKSKDKRERIVKLNDEALSAALEYLYKKSSEEFLELCGKKLANKLGILEDGILYSKSRLLEEQEIRAVGGLENVDIKSFAGVVFKVPLIHRNSPLAISISNHLH